MAQGDSIASTRGILHGHVTQKSQAEFMGWDIQVSDKDQKLMNRI